MTTTNTSIPMTPICLSLAGDAKIVIWTLCALYTLLVVIPFTQLIFIHVRSPDVGWTIQKLFLSFFSAASMVRVIFFVLLENFRVSNFFLDVGDAASVVILANIPRVIYFSSYCLLILFWAEILHRVQSQSRFSLSFDKKRNLFIVLNIVVYVIQVGFWLSILVFYTSDSNLPFIENLFFAGLSAIIGILFLVYGGQLFFMLKKYPVESQSKEVNSKLYEVGSVTVTCTICFFARTSFLVLTSIFGSIDLNAYVLLGYYLSSELIPGVLVLFILSNPRSGTVRNSSTDSQFPSSAEESFYGSAGVPPDEPWNAKSVISG